MGNIPRVLHGNGILILIDISVAALISSLCPATAPVADAPYKLCTLCQVSCEHINSSSVQVLLELLLHVGLVVTLGGAIHLDIFSLASCAVKVVEVALPMLLALFMMVDLVSSIFPFPMDQMKWKVSCLC